MEDKQIIGAVEKVTIKSTNSSKTVDARIDTGARLSSIDTQLVADLGLGPVIRAKKVKSAHGKTLRPIIKVQIMMAGRTFNEEFTFIDRGHMKYPVLIGRNIIEQGFIVDVNK